MKKREMVYKVLELLRDFEKRDMSKLDKAVKIVDFFDEYMSLPNGLDWEPEDV